MFATYVVLFLGVLARDEDDDPKKSLESLGAFFKMMSDSENGCKMSCPRGKVGIFVNMYQYRQYEN